ncbi:NADPH:quinone reductase-like Zn-dependent oxidoreductase [Kibdelosporangium banguiense]|uniref:NADPH:quinone reductase-like Zn-dependent oxidoreductase n=1 Tax=Kibdelosporangium banguiense TaxID=1365924 RepID=A0ABS4TWZ5_9PSEU|nr:zinc-binding dehydrogenase [Kibdelosporangium banguiense]MBP2328930.1 NADPH:quinone reductase-like Zn-dependent oxidoreductase [Kibdelosporangium banguiense]
MTGVAVGDQVFGLSPVTGTMAEYAVLSSWSPKPDAWTVEQAAAAGVVAETAIRVLDQLGVGADSTLLIDGAAGGVGDAVVQIAVGRGATVIGTASEANHEYLRSLGVIPTTYGPGLADRVRALAPAGVDAVFDVAGANLPDLVKIAPSADAVVSIADTTAPEHGARFSMSGTPDEITPTLVKAAALGAAGTYVPHVAATYRLDQVAEVHARIEAGHARGKIVIKI